MKNKKVKAILSAVVMVTATWSGICCAVKRGRRKKMTDDRISEPVLEEEGLTEEKVKEYLLRFFNLYEDSEFDDLAEFMQDNEGDPREYAADNYSGLLFPYIKSSMAIVMEMKGDDGKGEEPFCMTDELFHYPACMICRQAEEAFLDRFDLYRDNEIWMLENGEFVLVNCIELKKGNGYLQYRFIDKYITKPEDIPVSFEDMEAGFTAFMEKTDSE